MRPHANDTTEIRRFITDAVVERAKQFGLDQAAVNTFSNDRPLVDAGFLDSLGFVELLATIEEKYGIEIDLFEYDPEYFTTIDGLVAIVSGSQEQAALLADNIDEEKVPPEVVNRLVYEEITPAHDRWPQIATLFTDMYRYFVSHGLMLPLARNGGTIWLRSLEASIGKANHVIGCLHDDKLVAFMHSAIKVLPTYFEGKIVGVIANVYVIPEYRRMGIAGELLRRSEAWLYARNVSSIELQVLAGNESAITFWHKVGFETELMQMRKKRSGQIQ